MCTFDPPEYFHDHARAAYSVRIQTVPAIPMKLKRATCSSEVLLGKSGEGNARTGVESAVECAVRAPVFARDNSHERFARIVASLVIRCAVCSHKIAARTSYVRFVQTSIHSLGVCAICSPELDSIISGEISA